MSRLGGGTLAVSATGPAAGVSAIAPNAIDLASPPTSFTITGNGFANLGFGLPVVNFVRNGVLIAQARATGRWEERRVGVAYPTPATSLTPNMRGLSAGP